MEKEHVVLQFIRKQFHAELSPDREEEVLKAYRKEVYKRKKILFRPGDGNTRHYFVEKGLLRLYIIDLKGKEINILFAREGQVIGDLATPNPTSFYLETTEESTVFSIDEESLKELSKSFGINGQLEPGNVLRRSYIFMQQRLVSILSKSAEENYLEFQKRYPDLVQRLPQYHIASYLGISAEFLSKIIARTAKKK